MKRTQLLTAALATGCLVLVASAVVPAAAQPSGWTLTTEPMIEGLVSPVSVAHAGDGSDRLFIVEQAGRILVWNGKALLATPFLDITAQVQSTGNAQGLLGLAFHPDYPVNGLFFVNYTRNVEAGLDHTVVVRYRASDDDPNIADSDSAFTVLEFAQTEHNHNGGDIHFGPNGYLYIASGDGGLAGDPAETAQRLNTLLGKLLRIDVDGSPPAAGDLCGLVTEYAIPPGNPFAQPGASDGDCDEIWSLGLRSPAQFSFDRVTDDLILGDVGQNDFEEINFQPAGSPGGENWGWDCFEGSLEYEPEGCTRPIDYDFPILEYSHDEGCSVTAGYRYRGADPYLAGTYLYGDFCTGRIYGALPGCGGVWRSTPLAETTLQITTFGEDEKGELYVVGRGGKIQRLVRGPLQSMIFSSGFELPDLSDWSGCEGISEPPA